MRKLILPLILLVSYCSYAQKDESYFIFDGEWNPVKNAKKAKYFIHTEKLNDTCWQWDYYNFLGPRLKTESFKDADGKMPNGFFAYYNKEGYLDSCGYVANWKKDQYWTFFRGDSGKVYMRKLYDHGKLVRTEDYSQEKPEEEESEDWTFANLKIESEFTGGLGAWQSYLNKNLRYPERAINAESQGTVWILFIVDTEGKVKEPVVARSVEFSIDQESMRIIKRSPNWIPAIQEGRRVRSYKKQPIIFKLQ